MCEEQCPQRSPVQSGTRFFAFGPRTSKLHSPLARPATLPFPGRIGCFGASKAAESAVRVRKARAPRSPEPRWRRAADLSAHRARSQSPSAAERPGYTVCSWLGCARAPVGCVCARALVACVLTKGVFVKSTARVCPPPRAGASRTRSAVSAAWPQRRQGPVQVPHLPAGGQAGFLARAAEGARGRGGRG